MTDRVREIGYLGRISRKIDFRQVEQTVLHFLPNSEIIFGIFDDFSKFRSNLSALHFEKSQNVPKI